MFTWTTKASPPAATGVATPLLKHLTATFADRIAGLWAAPHAVFVTAEAARRHLICLALTEGPLNVETADGLLHWPLRRAVKIAFPNGPEGLGRALDLLGEIAWSEAEYRALKAMLAEPEAAKRLRHAASITPAQVLALAETPLPLLRAGLDRLGLDAGQTAIVREAWDIVERRDGPVRAAEAAARWGAARSPSILRERIGDDLTPPIPPPPFPGTARLRPITGKAELREAGQRFRNCLATYIPAVAEGESAIYEWLPGPGAAVEIRRDRLHGWSLQQARQPGNADVAEETQAAIIAELRAMGVHVGRAAWNLDQQLEWGLVHGHGHWRLEDFVRNLFTD